MQRQLADLDRQRKLARSFWSSEVAGTAVLAAVVGAITGLGAVGFIKLIELCQRLFFDGGAQAFSFLDRWYVLVLPILGGLVVGPLVHFLAPEARGHGVPEVMIAMETGGGRIRPRVALVKTLASAVTIGSGGAAGREGPIVQIGAAVGSVLGQVLKISRTRLLALVGAGAAGGIAATFNAPIAGLMFTLEVLVGEFSVAAVSSMVFASVSAAVVARMFLGDYPAFLLPEYDLASNWELLLYLGLGVFAALAAILFVRSLYFAEGVFEKWKVPNWVKPPVAGVAIGLLIFFLPEVGGTGFEAMAEVLRGGLMPWLVVGLIFARILATSLTLGAGFSGGVFSPALFIGAMLGSTYGTVMHHFLPGITAESGAYAMVGMAAVFAAAARAPVTAIVILFEMTLDYKIMLPLMFSTVVATLIASRIEPESIYTLKLVRRGIDFLGKRIGRLHPISVDTAMTPLSKVVVVQDTASLDELRELYQGKGQRGAVVIDPEGRLVGVVTMGDLERALVEGKHNASVGDICSRDLIITYKDDTLDEVVKHAGMLEVGFIPVVTREAPKTPVGVLRRSDIIRAYGTAISKRDRHRVGFERRRAEHVFGLKPCEFVLSEGDPGVGKTLLEISPPPESVIVSVIRGETTMVPRGSIRLKVGDRIMAMAVGDGGPILGRILKGRNYR